jgi:alpha-tubulin suppressor-like RCC1 family protein
MRKHVKQCAVAAAMLGILLLVMEFQPNEPKFQMGEPLPPGKVRPQLVADFDMAVLLAADGSLWAWGGTMFSLMPMFPQPAVSQVPLRIGSDSDWKQVVLSGNRWPHAVAVKSNGSLWAWGWNRNGVVGQPNLTNQYDTPTRIGAETNWVQISASTTHNLALKTDGSLWAWGLNNHGN